MNRKDIKTIRQGDPSWMLTDGMISYPRAMIHVLPECPNAYRTMIEQAMSNGYIKLVAHVYGKEYTMDAMR